MTVTASNQLNMLPFHDILQLISNMPDPQSSNCENHDRKSVELVCHPNRLGILDYLSRHMVIWQNRYPALIMKPEIAIFISSQTTELNALPDGMQDQTQEIVQSLHNGTAMINQVCNLNGYGLKVYDLNSSLPTEDITQEAAMSELEAAQVIAISMEAVSSADVLVLSELGHQYNFSATALAKSLFIEAYPFELCPVVSKAFKLHGVNHEPLELLRRYGSREISAMIGCIIAARYQNVPIILDGLSALVAAAIIYKIRPDGISHCLIGHSHAGQVHEFVAGQIGLVSVLSLGLQLDTGIGGALSLGVIKSALQIHNFTEAKLSL